MNLLVFELLRESYRLFIDFGDEFFETAGFMRCFSEQHLVEDDSHGPDIAFGGISVPIENLGAHVHGAADKGLMYLVKLRALLIKFGEPEICKFVCFVFDEDIGRF